MLTTVAILVFIALAFDFINGFHDSANSIATVVSTRVLSPKYAVLWAAFFNFVAAFFFETKVASTIGKGVVDPGAVTLAVVTAGLIGAIVWDLATWWLGLPSSSSHALIGGLAGAAVTHAGPIRALLCHCLGVPLERHWQFQVDAAGITIMEFYPAGALLAQLNETSHLALSNEKVCSDK